jgi:lysozyme family protein
MLRLCVSLLLAVLVSCKPTPGADPKPLPSKKPATRYLFQEERWREVQIRDSVVIRLDKAVAIYRENERRYKAIEKMSNVPAAVICVLHGRESTWNFNRHLHEGSPLTGRTRYVPKGRPLTGQPPFTFEESAVDALAYDRMGTKNWRSLGDSLQAIEMYNGPGYQNIGIVSPYLWAGSTAYSRGKFVSDGVFSPSAVDKQLGCATVLKWFEKRGVFGLWR